MDIQFCLSNIHQLDSYHYLCTQYNLQQINYNFYRKKSIFDKPQKNLYILLLNTTNLSQVHTHFQLYNMNMSILDNQKIQQSKTYTYNHTLSNNFVHLYISQLHKKQHHQYSFQICLCQGQNTQDSLHGLMYKFYIPQNILNNRFHVHSILAGTLLLEKGLELNNDLLISFRDLYIQDNYWLDFGRIYIGIHIIHKLLIDYYIFLIHI